MVAGASKEIAASKEHCASYEELGRAEPTLHKVAPDSFVMPDTLARFGHACRPSVACTAESGTRKAARVDRLTTAIRAISLATRDNEHMAALL